MTVTLRELEALCAVVEEGSFRAAARALGYTPSAVSHQLAGLERSLGVKLFLRPGGRARASLTPAGEVAYAQARRVLAGLTALGAEVAGVVDGRRASLSVGVIQTAAVELLPGSLRALRQTGTSTEVRLVEVHAPGDVAQALRQGSLDVAFAVNRS
ncbi:MAG: LysR family transcriptional regulator [Actinomycetota bacterium]|nr:LysR family transcriptional regulator [Actinomycetota bacterium]